MDPRAGAATEGAEDEEALAVLALVDLRPDLVHRLLDNVVPGLEIKKRKESSRMYRESND